MTANHNTNGVQVVIGAGPVGTALATLLAGQGARVRVLTRSGAGPELPGVERVSGDASDAYVLARHTKDAAVIYNCANPGTYVDWGSNWPPLAAAILEAATRSGAVLVTMSNLYGYGPVQSEITRSTPLAATEHKGVLRAQMWRDALSAHERGEVRVTEARASDYIGATVGDSGILRRYATPTLQGRPAYLFSSPDVPHTWTAIEDVAKTLAVLGRDERAWGSAWIVPSNPPKSIREVLTDLNDVVGVQGLAVRQVPRWVLRFGGVWIPLLREVNGVMYQFDAPFVAGGHETTEAFGIKPAPWQDITSATALAWAEGLRL